MAPNYYFGAQRNEKINADFIFSANNDGDFTIETTKSGAIRHIRSSRFSKKKYDCFEAIVSDILREYPENVSVYFTEAAAEAIANLVKQNKRLAA